MSANVYLGGKNDRPGLERIACYLANADIAFLQEADKEAAKTLARKSGLTNLRFTRARGDEYEIAILSRKLLGPPEVYERPEIEQLTIKMTNSWNAAPEGPN